MSAGDDIRWRMRVELSDGRVADDSFSRIGFGPSLLGSADVNGDGRDEMFIQTGGATGVSGELVAFENCRVLEIKDRSTGQYFAFGYYGHSTGAPHLRVGFLCFDATGDGVVDPIAVNSEADRQAAKDLNGNNVFDPQDFAENPTKIPFLWTKTVYRLDGHEMVVVSETSGRYEQDTGQPELSNNLRCGDVSGGLAIDPQ